MTRDPGMTLSEKLGASAGAWAVLWLTLHYLILRGTAANPASLDTDYVGALLRERMAWESATALRVMGGIMIIWFMGSLASRLRMAEGEPGRLASIAFGIGVVWGAIWLLSAMMNSSAIMLATHHQNPAGARLAGALAGEMVLIHALAGLHACARDSSAFLRWRSGPYTCIDRVLVILMRMASSANAVRNLGYTILALAFAWTAVTSLLLVPGWMPPDMVRGTR